jgi:hypothetical protein
MIRSKSAMGLLWALVGLALHFSPGIVSPAHAQVSRKDDIVFNTGGIPLTGATIRVCAMPASGQPCTPLALIYSDAALTPALAKALMGPLLFTLRSEHQQSCPGSGTHQG